MIFEVLPTLNRTGDETGILDYVQDGYQLLNYELFIHN